MINSNSSVYSSVISTKLNSQINISDDGTSVLFFQLMDSFIDSVCNLILKVPPRLSQMIRISSGRGERRSDMQEYGSEKESERPEICLVRSVAIFISDLWNIQDRYLVSKVACKFVEGLMLCNYSRERQYQVRLLWICRLEVLKIYIESPHYFSLVLAYSPYFASPSSPFKAHSLPWKLTPDHALAHLLVYNCWGCLLAQAKLQDLRINMGKLDVQNLINLNTTVSKTIISTNSKEYLFKESQEFRESGTSLIKV
jgi:hypothetical protein